MCEIFTTIGCIESLALALIIVCVCVAMTRHAFVSWHKTTNDSVELGPRRELCMLLSHYIGFKQTATHSGE